MKPLFRRQDVFRGVSHPIHPPDSDGPDNVYTEERLLYFHAERKQRRSSFDHSHCISNYICFFQSGKRAVLLTNASCLGVGKVIEELVNYVSHNATES